MKAPALTAREAAILVAIGNISHGEACYLLGWTREHLRAVLRECITYALHEAKRTDAQQVAEGLAKAGLPGKG